MANDVDAQHLVGRGIGEDFHKAIGVLHGAGAAVGGEGEFAGLVGDACRFQLFLGLADRGDFRRGVDNAGNDIKIHMAMLASHDFGNGNAFVFRLVRKHRALDHIANGIDAGDRCLPMAIHFNAAAVVEHHTRFGKAKTASV